MSEDSGINPKFSIYLHWEALLDSFKVSWLEGWLFLWRVHGCLLRAGLEEASLKVVSMFSSGGDVEPCPEKLSFGPGFKTRAHWMIPCLMLSVSLGHHLCCWQECAPALPGCTPGSTRCSLLYPWSPC